MEAFFSGDETLTRQMLAEISDLAEQPPLCAFRYGSFPACRVDAAFRLMAQGKHIGKVVVALPAAFLPPRGEPLAPTFAIDPEGCYLITGAFGGFGKVLAQWLVDSGARHLVLTSRSGAATPDAEAFVQGLRKTDADVRVLPSAVGSPHAL